MDIRKTIWSHEVHCTTNSANGHSGYTLKDRKLLTV